MWMGQNKDAAIGFGVIIVIIVIVVGVVVWAIEPGETEPAPNESKIIQRESSDETVKEKIELPESCDGVASTETWLYPTAEECMTMLYFVIYSPCWNNSDLSQTEIDACMDRIDYAIDQSCKAGEEGLLGIKYEVCVMHTLKELYQRWNVN